MANPLSPMIQGNRYDGGSIEARINSRRLFFTSIDYADNRTQGEIPNGRYTEQTVGTINPSGSAEMPLDVFNELMQMVGVLGGYGRAKFPIYVTYGDMQVPIVDTLVDVTFSPSATSKVGSDPLMRTIEFKYKLTMWNGVPFTIDTPTL